jgi:hypothetical protein
MSQSRPVSAFSKFNSGRLNITVSSGSNSNESSKVDIYAPLEETINVKNKTTSLSGPYGDEIIIDNVANAANGRVARNQKPITANIPSAPPAASPKRKTLSKTSSSSTLRKKKRLFKKPVQKVYVPFEWEFPEMRNVMRMYKFSVDDEANSTGTKPMESTNSQSTLNFTSNTFSSQGLNNLTDEDDDFMILSSIKKPKVIEEKEKMEKVLFLKLVDDERRERMKERKREKQKKLEQEELQKMQPFKNKSKDNENADSLSDAEIVDIESIAELVEDKADEFLRDLEKSSEAIELVNKTGSIYFKQDEDSFRYSFVDREKRSFKRSNSDTNLYSELFTALSSKHNNITNWDHDDNEEHNMSDLASMLIDPTLASKYQLPKLAQIKKEEAIEQGRRCHSEMDDIHLINRRRIEEENEEYNEGISRKLSMRAKEREEKKRKEAEEAANAEKAENETKKGNMLSVVSSSPRLSPRARGVMTPRRSSTEAGDANQSQTFKFPNFMLKDETQSSSEEKDETGRNRSNSNPANEETKNSPRKETSTHRSFSSPPRIQKREKIDFISRNIKLIHKLNKEDEDEDAKERESLAEKRRKTRLLEKLGVPVKLYAVNKLSIDLRNKPNPNENRGRPSYMGTPMGPSTYNFPAKPTSLNARKFVESYVAQQEEEEETTWAYAKPTNIYRARPKTAQATRPKTPTTSNWPSALGVRSSQGTMPHWTGTARTSPSLSGSLERTTTMMGMTVTSGLAPSPKPSTGRSVKLSRLGEPK